MQKKFEIYSIQKIQFWSEKAVCSPRLCTKRCFFAIQGGGRVLKVKVTDRKFESMLPLRAHITVYTIITYLYIFAHYLFLLRNSLCPYFTQFCSVIFAVRMKDTRYKYSLPPGAQKHVSETSDLQRWSIVSLKCCKYIFLCFE